MLDPDGAYNIIRCDRANHRTGGGVCVLLHVKYNLRKIPLSSIDDAMRSESGCDILHIEISKKNFRFRMILVYRPPNIDKYANVALIKLLSSLVDPHLLDSTIVLGDFNLPFINWSNSCVRNDGIHDSIFDCMTSLGMSQIVTQPTRISNTGQSSTLDLIFTNDPLSINIVNYMPPFSTSDHLMIHFEIYYNTGPNTAPDDTNSNEIYLPKYDWSNGDYDRMNEYLFNIDWHLLFGFNFDPNSLWDNFKSIIWPIIELYVPKKMIPHHKKYSSRFYPKRNEHGLIPFSVDPRDLDIILRTVKCLRSSARMPTINCFA